jgi:hypothetical protein
MAGYYQVFLARSRLFSGRCIASPRFLSPHAGVLIHPIRFSNRDR